ncbi:hypothetical protein [Pedobacter sp. MC2016-24]|uniref:hypothetical protein n=1 Tax=Pedobacter sp. MC2016-24 TaxID=2780090 RepID=UPI0018819A37|nr:hypothetical protein [Pedobacter sp. MC2016-24]MBE9602260.1 hypothetical protein [Pedobacter sp. MC2016-24]
MRNGLLFLKLLVLLSSSSYSQEKDTDRLRSEIFKIVTPKDQSYLEQGQFKSSVITFSFAIGTDEQGDIDTIDLSNSVLNVHSNFVNFERIKKELRKQEHIFEPYKNMLFFGMVMVANGELDYIRPNQLYTSWPKLLQNLQPLLGKRKLIIYDPFLTLFYYKKSD